MLNRIELESNEIESKSNRTIKMADVTISKVRLKTLMKEIFKEEFEKQQKNLLNLISDINDPANNFT